MAPGIIMSAILCFAPAAGTKRRRDRPEIRAGNGCGSKGVSGVRLQRNGPGIDGSTKTYAVHRRVRRVSEFGQITRLKDGRAALAHKAEQPVHTDS